MRARNVDLHVTFIFESIPILIQFKGVMLLKFELKCRIRRTSSMRRRNTAEMKNKNG